MGFVKKHITRLLASAGVQIGGIQPWDIQVLDDRFYYKTCSKGSLGFGEAYVNKWWETEALDELFYRLLRSNLHAELLNIPRILLNLWSRVINLQSIRSAIHSVSHHYDIGNDLYQAMLDRRMVYTGAFWEPGSDLNQAQATKLEMVCQKLNLQPGQKVVDVGCGWGSFAKYAAENYQCEVTGITLSKEQVKHATELCHGLPVEVKLLDYRKLTGLFDHVVSLGMFEHVGSSNYSRYMKKVASVLHEKGTFLLQTIGSNTTNKVTDPWINRYIFPNSHLPSIRQIGKSIESLFVMEDWHNFGVHYDKTLMAWFGNFNRSWPKLKEKYSERFYRMWKYYLLSCAGAFRSRHIQLWQLVLSKKGLSKGFDRKNYPVSESKYLRLQ